MTLKDLGMPSPYEEIKELREKLKIAIQALKKCRKDFVESDTEIDENKTANQDIISVVDKTLKKLGEK